VTRPLAKLAQARFVDVDNDHRPLVLLCNALRHDLENVEGAQPQVFEERWIDERNHASSANSSTRGKEFARKADDEPDGKANSYIAPAGMSLAGAAFAVTSSRNIRISWS